MEEIEVEKVRDSVSVEGDVSLTDEDVKEEIREEFDVPNRIDDQTVQQTVDDALEAIVSDEQEHAAELLAEEFTTPCAETKPGFTDHGQGHRSACIRHRKSFDSMELAMNDD